MSLIKNEQIEKQASFPIVAIGASAGGLNAVLELFKNLPANTGFSYIYIQHLDRAHGSNLVPILQRVTTMQVVEAHNLIEVKPNYVYVIPPDRQMELVDGVLQLSQRDTTPVKYDPIDHFFLSLAEKRKEASIGILLSGADTDGTVGLKAIKTVGGLTFVQDTTAEFDTMPKNAVAEGVADTVLSPEKIAVELIRLSHSANILKTALKEDSELDSEDGVDDADIGDISILLQQLKKSLNVDFTSYKQTTIRRRIIRRMLLQKVNNVAEYTKYLRKNPHEIGLLYQDLLINVTRFFRDEAAFEYLATEVFPQMRDSWSSGKNFRIWVPACSTGEEPYSLAMLMIEILGETFVMSGVQIFASDLSETAIAKARAGIYSHADVAEISKERLERFFIKTDGHYRILKSIREVCIFAPHNVLKDPPFSRVNIISCCNLMIYFENNLQKQLLQNFHYSLVPSGILVLGKSETTSAAAELFTQVDKRVKIYTKKNELIKRPFFEIPSGIKEFENYEKPVARPRFTKQDIPTETVSLERIVDNIIVNQYAPAGVVINSDFDIIQFRGSTGMFLEQPVGKPTFNLLKMARTGLQLELKNCAKKVLKTDVPEKKTGVEIDYKGSIHHVNFTIIPLSRQTNQRLLLILFEEMRIASTEEIKALSSRDSRVKQLEAELAGLQEDMRILLESEHTAFEELQSANEEITSSNEELQSINEELETSKEELESTNEELLTINQEFQVRNEQLSEEQKYAEGIITTIREAVLILDGTMRVKTANKVFYTMFKLKEQDIEGKLIYEILGNQWNIPKLKELLDEILVRQDQYNGFEVKHSFNGVGEKVLLINARRVVQKAQGQQFIFLAIEDITEHKQAERLLQERETWMRNMANNVPVMIWVAAADKNFTFLNNRWLEFTGRTLLQETGLGWTVDVHPEDLSMVMKAYHDSFSTQEPYTIEYRLKRKDGMYRWVRNAAVPSFEDGVFAGFIGSCIDIHDQKLMSEELENKVKERTSELVEVNENLERSNHDLSQFAYVASHDLQEPLRKIITFSTRLNERFKEQLPDVAQEFINKIGFSAERMRHLIDDLLNFSRISRSDQKFVKTDLNKVLQNVLTDFDLLLQDKNGSITADNMPVVKAIPLQINQLFYNLLGNGLKFCKRDVPPEIRITCRKLTEEEIAANDKLVKGTAYYEIAFADNGIGFQQEFSTQIFEIFQRLNEKDEYPGTGIGLSLCDKIVSSHRGAIYARGKEGEGATFFVILPEQQLYP
jgi:two-component system CheB/CheR fusion protein